jgi:hypothetical protein
VILVCLAYGILDHGLGELRMVFDCGILVFGSIM